LLVCVIAIVCYLLALSLLFFKLGIFLFSVLGDKETAFFSPPALILKKIFHFSKLIQGRRNKRLFLFLEPKGIRSSPHLLFGALISLKALFLTSTSSL
jgi:hypothetical protein